MALEVTNLQRVFNYNKDGKIVPLADPNPDLSVEEILKIHAATYPELTNGIVEGPVVEKDKAVFTIKTKAGKLG